MRWIAAALCLAGRAAADELTEDQWAIREARLSNIKEIRRSLDRTERPLDRPEGASGPNALHDLLERVAGERAKLQPAVDRLKSLKERYKPLEDLSEIDAERAEARRAIERGGEAYHEELERLAAVQRIEIAAQFQTIAKTGPGQGTLIEISNAMRIGKTGKDLREFEKQLREALGEDAAAYAQRRDELDEIEARRRAYRNSAIAGTVGTLLLGVAAIGLWRRRREGAGPLGPGRTVAGKYRLDRELGRGGMGVVFEATDIALGRKVAIKQLRGELKQDPNELQMFLTEARLVAALKHRHIVEIYEIVDEEDDLLLVFERVEGQPLHAALQRIGRLSIPQARSLIMQVGEALDFAHAQKVIHRDLKPENIMITPQGSAKVMDFGLAHRASQTVARQTRAASSGTPPYMAPEQELGSVSRESDLYSLGVMVYEALTGELPFPGPNYLAQKRELHMVPPSERVPALPKTVDGFIHRALQPDPALRFHSAAEFVRAFGTVA